jgi:hypothetical protein
VQSEAETAMIMPVVILIFSTALFFFYLQTICERALQREFSHPYFQDILQAVQLEYPAMRQNLAENASLDYSQIRLALECDFTTLSYLLKNSDRERRGVPWQETLLLLYFRFLLFWLPVRCAFKLHEREAALKLTTMVEHFANLTGEKLSAGCLESALTNH